MSVLADYAKGDCDFDTWYSLPTLRKGAKGFPVKHFQELLRLAQPVIFARFLKNSGGADGSFGPATEQAVRYLQEKQGWDQSGVVDSRLWGIFSAWVAPAAPTTTSITPHFTVAQAISKGNGQWIPLWVPLVAAVLEEVMTAAGASSAISVSRHNHIPTE